MLSKNVKGVKASLTLAITSKAKQMKKEGYDVISFAAGEPFFSMSDKVKKAGIKAIKEEFTNYTTASGIIELKQAIVKKFKRDNKLTYSPEEIIVCNGGKQALFNAIFALANKEDEFIIPKPYWVSYIEQVKLAGAKPIIAETKNFEIKAELIEKKITKKTKCLILNSPCNPTGAVISKEELKKIAKLAKKHDFYIISDEVYESFLYDDEHHSIALFPGMKKRTITINSISKAYALTGLRIGYCGASKELISEMKKIQGHSTSNACSIAQKMAVVALSEKPKVELKKTRDYVVKRLNKMGLKCESPKGAFYVFPKIEKMSSTEFCKQLLQKYKVATIPGIAFGNDKYIRICYSGKRIKQGLDRIEKFVRGLK